MARQNGNTTSPSAPAEVTLKNLDMPPIPPRFDAALMGKHSELLGQAGELLSQAYATANFVETIASIVRRSQIARQLGDECLDGSEEDHLLGAVTMLSHQLSETLCEAADRFDDELSKGGVQ